MTRITVDTTSTSPVELYVEDVGSGDPVVLIHGWPLSGRSWEAQVLPLVEAGHRVITYDRRGFGQSSRPWTGYDYDTMAADLDAVLTELDLRDVTLVGFSMGGGEVARYIGNHGTERITKAVFASAVPPFLLQTDDNPDGGLDEAAIEEFEGAVRGDRLAFLEQFASDFYSVDGELQTSEAQRQQAIRLAASASPKATLDCIAAWGRTDFRDDLAAFDVPTLVLHGDSDAIVPLEVSGKRTADLVADAKLEVVKGGPHGINVTHTEQFNEALLRFLDS